MTRLLKERWPDAHVTGVDDSQEMLAKAAAAAPEHHVAARRPRRVAARAAGGRHLLERGAALDRGPRPALCGSRGRAFAGGVLAVQMPRNFSAPSHTAIAEAARSGPWRARLEPLLRPAPVAEPAFYFDLLAPRVATLDIWETEYLQVLEGENPVKEWTKGTWLRPLLDALGGVGAERGSRRAYGALVARAYPPRADGHTLFPFRRLFIVARAR